MNTLTLENGKKIVFGRTRSPLGGQRRMRFEDYTRQLPMPPAAVDYEVKAAKSLHDILGNDQYGDCVFAGAYHVKALTTANAGNPFFATRAQVLADYTAVTGFNQNDPSTDRGANLVDMINYLKVHGFANGNKLLGALKINASNLTEVKQALWMFENLYCGLELPNAYVNPFPSEGSVWDLAGAPNPNQGHCVIFGGYGATGLGCVTWGMEITMTFAAFQAYMAANVGGEVWVLLDSEMVAKGMAKAPNGLAWVELIQDFNLLGGNVPVPVVVPPKPAPPVVVVPPAPHIVPGMSLDQAMAAAAEGAAAGARSYLQARWPH